MTLSPHVVSDDMHELGCQSLLYIQFSFRILMAY